MKTQGNQLSLGPDRILFVGDLPATGWHRHGAPVLLIGLSGALDISFPGGVTERCRSVLVDADVEHALDTRGEQVATLYLEPDLAEARSLRQLLLQGRQAAFDVAVPARVRARTDRRLEAFDLAALLKGSVPMVPPVPLDPRIAKALPLLRGPLSTPPVRGDMAGAVHLSESRFNHLFTEQMGVCFRRYRSWSLLRNTLHQIARQHSMTDAALQAGLHDSAHFSRLFRDMIGLTPSSVLRGLSFVEWR